LFSTLFCFVQSIVKGKLVDFNVKLHPNESVQYLTVSKSLSVDTHPFSEEHFLEAENGENPWRVIRWRTCHDGVVESNARLVTWSDGSQSVYIGKDTM
jgi:hypothetical protein